MRLAVLIVSLVTLAACAPKLTFVTTKTLHGDEFFNRSTHLFLGIIEDQVFPFYPLFRLPGDDSRSWRILRRRIKVEAVLKGFEPRPYIYLYEIFLTGGKSGDWNFTPSGERYLIPACVEDGVYHVSADFWRSIFPVQSGRHSRLPLDDSRPMSERIALLEYWPGPDHDRSFPPWNQRFSLPDFPWRDVKLLRGLLRNPEAAIRTQACVALVRLQLAQDECLSQIPREALNEGIIQSPEEQIAANRRFEQRAQQDWQYNLDYPRPNGELGMLRIFTTISNPTLRAHFCQEFTRHFPDDPDHGCPADHSPPATIVTEAGDVPLNGPWPAP
ncbi:MAG: hypothetical protein ABI972_08845 [Acidobacteriota bacterium]